MKTITPAQQEIFLEPAQDEQYCQENVIEILHLKNGATLGAVHRSTTDSVSADVSLYFDTGAYRDPIPGIAHLMEHLVSHNPDTTAKENDTHYAASTSARTVYFIVAGVANPDVQDFGVWPVLPVLLDTLRNPFIEREAEDALQKEKAVVIREYHETEPRRAKGFTRFIDTHLLGKKHPNHTPILGTEETVNSITTRDVTNYSSRLFTPHNLIIRVVTEGDLKTTHVLRDEIIRQFGTLESDKKPVRISQEIEDSLNPEYKNGSVYSKFWDDSRAPYTVNFAWLYQLPEYSFETIPE
ncbi:insulinase family protein [Candidatus Roizmanbacteria bacterium]|nr:insulinase family protein [Candidatus Roizmanbacteria bacterium]